MRDGQIVALDNPANLKKSTFPEPLFELTPRTRSGQRLDWLKILHKDKAVLSVKPYGMRYHAIIRNARGWKALSKRLAGEFQARPIQPSLEDVFIRVVEGAK
jgi:hypothetical protein